MKIAKYLLIVLFIVVATGFTVYAKDYEVIKEVTIDLEDYSKTANIGGRVSELLYHEPDSSYYVLLQTYPKEMYDQIAYHGSHPAIMKLNHNLEIEWLQDDFWGIDTIGNFFTFEVNDDGSCRACISYQLYDEEHIGLCYMHIAQFEVGADGTIFSRKILGNGEINDSSVVYRIPGGGLHYQTGKPQKIDDTFYLLGQHNQVETSLTEYAYILRFNPETFSLKRDSVYLLAINHNGLAFKPLINHNYLFFTEVMYDLNYKSQRTAIYNSKFEITADTTGNPTNLATIYDSSAYFLNNKLVNGKITALTMPTDTLNNGNRDLKVYQFDSEDGSYLGLDRKVEYPLARIDPAMSFDEDGRLYGVAKKSWVNYDTLGTDSIVKKQFSTCSFLYEKELGVLDTFAVKTFESVIGFNNAVQSKSDEFIVAGNVVKYSETRMAGYLYFAKIKKKPAVGVIDAEVEKKNMMYYLWVYNAYPNPAHSSTNIKFFCTPKYLAGLKVVIYDEMGRAYPATDYEISNYDSSRGIGTIRIPLTGISSGPKYIMLQVKNDSFTTCIMVE